MITPRVSLTATLVAAMLAAAAAEVSAVTVDFEPPNYSPIGGEDNMGVLARQGSQPPPHDDASMFGCGVGDVGCWRNEFAVEGLRVASGVGVDGSQGLVPSGGDFYRYIYETDDALLDFAGGSTFDNASSTLFYEFNFRLDNVTANAFSNSTAFSFGVTGNTSENPAVELIIQDKNALGILHGNGATFTSSFDQSNNDPMLAPGEWQRVRGEVNYATQTFTVEINDIPWTFQSIDDSGDYAFRSTINGNSSQIADSIDGANLWIVADNRQSDDPDFVLDDFTLTSIAPPVEGDYDGNGSVGPEDYNLWASTFGSTVLPDADGNGDGVVDAADYTIWRDNFFPAPPATAIPEPAAAALLLLGLPLVASRRRGVCRGTVGHASV